SRATATTSTPSWRRRRPGPLLRALEGGDDAEQLLRVNARIDVREHARDLAVGSDEERHALGAAPDRVRHVVGLLHRARHVRAQRERQGLLLLERLVTRFGIARDPEDRHARGDELVESAAERAGLLGAA